MANIGYLTTFSEFITKNNVEIPRIQRDFTYGAKTEKTEKILDKLLRDIYDALRNKKELILDFIYGSQDVDFQPLDGQQRLTTLFLIHFYAAVKAGQKLTVSFKYATRDDSTIFCNELLSFKYDPKEGPIVGQIKNSPFFRPSFVDDPSIRSILVVLERIETKFADMVAEGNPRELWDLLTVDCPVKFYCLDFGQFTLSDDLYIKMNSRGKQLTEYEIFKSQFEKYIELILKDKPLMYKVARLFDNDYTDLIWDRRGRDKTKIDSSFVFIFRNLFLLINYKNKQGRVELDMKKPLFDNLISLSIDNDDVKFILDFLDVFRFSQLSHKSFLTDNFYKDDNCVLHAPVQSDRIRFFKSNVDVLADACVSILRNPQIVTLFAIYCAMKAEKSGKEWTQGFRHVRNLIEFSDDELGHSERLAGMLSEVELIIDGKINTISDKHTKFNTAQFEEELEKDRHREEWKQLYEFENHDILRGSLTRFSHPKQFSLGSKDTFNALLDRLRKFVYVFDDTSKLNDQKIRASLLSIGDISQQHDMNVQNRMVGSQYGSWRMLFTFNSYFKSNSIRIMDVIDKIDMSTPMTINPVSKDNWRYYVTAEKYYLSTYVSYNGAKYGYYYFADSTDSMEMWLLQSTSCNSDNVMWKLMNKLLFDNLPSGLNVHYYKYQEDHKVKLNNILTIDSLKDGWQFEDLSDDNHIMTWLISNTDINDGLLSYKPNTDHIEEMLSVIKKLMTAKVL